MATTSKERIDLALQHREADRVALYDSPWPTTVRRWREEGLPDGKSPAEYFGYEIANVGYDRGFGITPEVLEETDEYVIRRTNLGSVTKDWKNRASTPELIDFLIKDEATWREVRDRYRPNEGRVDLEKTRQAVAQARAAGKWIALGGGFGFQLIFSRIVGPERTMVAMAENPDWAREMFEAVGEMTIGMAEIMLGAGVELDGAHLADDLGYRNGPFFSPAMYRELLFPIHRRVCDFFAARGLPVILHACGNVNELLPHLIEAGISALNPLEVKAGMDLLSLKREVGDAITLIGGIDVRTWARGDLAEIEAEIAEKVGFAKNGGGYIFHSDHSIPDNVSFETYQHVVELAHRYGRYA